MNDVDFRRSEMVRLAQAVKGLLNSKWSDGGSNYSLSPDEVEQVLQLAEHVLALDHMLQTGSVLPTRWQNDGTLGVDAALIHDEALEEAARVADDHCACGGAAIRALKGKR